MDWKMPKMDGIETTRRLQNVLPSDHSPAMIMVTAYGKDEVTEAAHDINVDNFLIKPVNPSTLFNTTMQALGHSVVAPTRTERQSEAISQAVTQLKGARILLVEDNAINQELALELLNSSEIEVTVANNGQEALDCLQHQAFDGILMDMQMPVMDGCTASRAIRQQPQFETVPIIAMTANAMAGDREKCQEAGMNDHIAKPIDVEAMFSTMAKWITVAQPPAATDQFPQQQADLLSLEGIIDSKIGLAAVKGDGQRYRKMLCKFRDQQHDLIEQFRQARNSAAADSAIRQLIVLKGMAGAIGAIEIRKAAEALESACQDDASEAQIDSLIIGLDQALKPVIAALEKLE